MTDIAYTVNLSNRATSRYLHWPFLRVRRLRGQYLGISSSVLYTVGGATADGADIDTVATLGPADFGSDFQKRMEGIHIGARFSGDLDIEVANDNQGLRVYRLSSNSETGLHQRRKQFGRGRRGRYWTITLKNVAGGAFDMDSATLLVNVLKRRV